MPGARFGVATFLWVGLAVLPLAAPGADASKPPPPGAVVPFNGKDLANWTRRDGKPAEWAVRDGYMEVRPGNGDIMCAEKVGPAFRIHIEFWLPAMPDAKGQARANSGVFLQGRYEVQVLDSYGNETYANGSVGALYGLIAPDPKAQQKALRPPEQWQTYDITFHAPRPGDSDRPRRKGSITVVLNGITIIDHGEFDRVTAGAIDEKIDQPGPILLQDHGCKVRYRNLWIQRLPANDK